MISFSVLSRFLSPFIVTVVALLAIPGCISKTPDSETTQTAELQPVNLELFRYIQQRSGEVPPVGIIDVKSTGIALIDIDSEGQPEILLTSGSTTQRYLDNLYGFPPVLLKHDGNLDYQVVPGAAGLDRPLQTDIPWVTGVAAADLDADGDDDLLLTGIGISMLFENRNGHFYPLKDSGIDTSGWCTSAAFGDLDLDGDLDLYVCRYLDYDFESPPVHGEEWSCLWENQEVLCGPKGLPALHDLVFENMGGLNFREVTNEWGYQSSEPGYGLAVVIIDLLGDPHPEIFVANDSTPNHLWSRQENSSWQEEGLLSGLGVDQDGQEQAGMGIAVGDIDGNDTLDLVVTNFEKESLNLYLNNGDGTFQDAASSYGLTSASRPMLSWGVGVQDLNLDGMLDIFVANGHVYPQADLVASSPGYLQKDQFWLATKSAGKIRFLQPDGGNSTFSKHAGRCAVFSDLDLDGDIDVLTSSLNGSPFLYKNKTPSESTSVQIRLRQPGLNREAIGAIVTVEGGGHRSTMPVIRQSSFQSSLEAKLTFGTSKVPEGSNVKVEVRWPDGKSEVFTIAKDGRVELTRDHGSVR